MEDAIQHDTTAYGDPARGRDHTFERSLWSYVEPNPGVSAGSTQVSFEVPMDSKGLTAMDELYLETQLEVRTAGGAEISPRDFSSALSSSVVDSLFSRVSVSINSIEVSDKGDDYVYSSFVKRILTQGAGSLDCTSHRYLTALAGATVGPILTSLGEFVDFVGAIPSVAIPLTDRASAQAVLLNQIGLPFDGGAHAFGGAAGNTLCGRLRDTLGGILNHSNNPAPVMALLGAQQIKNNNPDDPASEANLLRLDHQGC